MAAAERPLSGAGGEVPSGSRTSDAPPRPRLTVRVGITGHRWDKLDPARRGALTTQLRAILQQIHEIAHRISDDPDGGYRPAWFRPGEPRPMRPELRILSALAEGADRLIVDAAPKGWRLQALLPFPESVYRADFAKVPDGEEDPFTHLLQRARTEAGVVILDGDRAAINAFEPVGTLLCLNSDVLVTVWNGEASTGRGRGGTATVVELARRLGIPIIRVAPDAATSPWLDDGGGPRPADGSLAGLEGRMQRTLAAPPSPYVMEEDGGRTVREDLRELYFREVRPAHWRGQLYSVVIGLLNLHLVDRAAREESWRDLRRALRAVLPRPEDREHQADFGEAIRSRWRRQWVERLGLPAAFVEPLLATPLADHYGWSSRLAAHYAGRYRGAFLLGYALSWVAVLAGAAGLAIETVGYHEHRAPLLTGLVEFLLLVTILWVVVRARIGKYHERWLDYRRITEALRPLTYALPAERTAIRRIGLGDERDSWVDWLHRAIVREAGLYPAELTPGHLASCRRLLVEGELAEQVKYHRRNARILSLAGRRLHRWATLIFWLGLLLAGFHVWGALVEGQGPDLSPLTIILIGTIGVTIPAVASAFHGFVSQAEFEESAQRSRSTARRLEELCGAGSDTGFPLTSAAVGDLVAESAGAMGEEVGAWFATYQGKGVPLP